MRTALAAAAAAAGEWTRGAWRSCLGVGQNWSVDKGKGGGRSRK